MATPKTLNRLHAWIWILAYGGLLTLVLGLATQREDAALGQCLIVIGAIVAACGFVLIYVRSRLHASDSS